MVESLNKVLYSSKTNRTSILVVCSDFRKAITQNCLSLIKQNTTNYELLIMDNGDDPNFSHPAEMNRAIRSVDTDFLVLMDDDVYVETGWLDGLLSCIDDQVAVVVPLHKGKESCAGSFMVNDGTILITDPSYFQNFPWSVQTYSSALMLIDMRKIGFIKMQEQYRKYYFDSVHALEVWEAGYRAVCTPHVSITHLVGATFKTSSNDVLSVTAEDLQLFSREWLTSGRLKKLELKAWNDDPWLGTYVEAIRLARQMINENISPLHFFNIMRQSTLSVIDRKKHSLVLQYMIALDNYTNSGTDTINRDKFFSNGRILYYLRSWIPAGRSFQKAIALNQNDVAAWMWMGLAAEMSGDMQLATIAQQGSVVALNYNQTLK